MPPYVYNIENCDYIINSFLRLFFHDDIPKIETYETGFNYNYDHTE